MTESDGSLSRPVFERGAQAAHALRFELGLGLSPIVDLWDLVDRRQADLAFHPFGPGGGDGLYVWDGKRGLIVANSSKHGMPLRVRFTVAHELGHHEMHRSPDATFVVADRDVETEESDLEREANAFAAVLLAPDRALQEDLRARESESIEVIDVVRLMHRYGLSYAALLNRLAHAGCIRGRDRTRLKSEGQHGRIKKVMKAIGFDDVKTFPVPRHQLPTGYVLSVSDLYQRGVFSEHRLAHLLRARQPEARELADSMQPSLSEELSASEEDELDALLSD